MEEVESEMMRKRVRGGLCVSGWRRLSEMVVREKLMCMLSLLWWCD